MATQAATHYGELTRETMWKMQWELHALCEHEAALTSPHGPRRAGFGCSCLVLSLLVARHYLGHSQMFLKLQDNKHSNECGMTS